MTTVNIETSDSVVFKVPKGIAFYFETLADVLENYDESENIPINTPASLFKEVLDFAEHCYLNETKEAEWINAVSADKLHFFALIGEVNTLTWKHLLKLMAKKIADNIQGKTAEEMKEYLEFDEVLMEDYMNTIKASNPRMITA